MNKSDMTAKFSEIMDNYQLKENSIILGTRIGFGVVSLILLLALFSSAGGAQPVSANDSNQDEQNEDSTKQAEQQRQLTTSRDVTWNLESVGIRSILTGDHLDRFSDYTIEDALARMAGVQVDRRRHINLRGVGLNRYLVTVDGQRMASTGVGDRSFDLSSISTDLVSEVEVIKVPTSDMDAEGLGGNINLITLRQENVQPVERQLQARFGGGTNTRYMPYAGLGSRVSLHYSEALQDNLSLELKLSHQQDQRGRESLELDYDVADFGEGPVDVIERVAPALHTDENNRYGGVFELTFQPSERNRYQVRGILNHNDRERIRHRQMAAAGSDWIRVDSTGAEGGLGSTHYDMRFRDSNIRQYALRAGGRHLFGSMELDYKVEWGQSSFSEESHMFRFGRDGLNYIINMEDRTRPFMRPTNIRVLEDGTIDRQIYRFQNVEQILNNHVDNTVSSRVDLEIPYGMGSFKFGSSTRLIHKDGDFSDADYEYTIGRQNLFDFSVIRSRKQDVNILDRREYRIPWLIDAHDTHLFYETNDPLFNRDDVLHDLRSDIWNYTISERTFAGYGMTTLEWNRWFTFLGGVRLEYDNIRHEGRKLTLSEDGELQDALPATRNTSRTHVFPNIQFLFSASDATRMRFAYSRTIQRPAFNYVAPFERTNMQDSTLFHGNPDLDPMFSDNFDVIVEQHIGSTGSFSFGIFHKNITNFVYERQRTLNQGNFDGFQERTFVNSEEAASLYGTEFTWQQRLDFLPGFLSHLGTYATYTWSHSEFTVPYRDDEVRLPGQSPNVVNIALDFSRGRIFTQVSYHWTAEALALDGLQSERQLAPAIDQTQAIFLDRNEDGWTDISVSFRFRLSDNFSFWADAANLLGGMERVQYAGSRDYPIGTDFIGGRTFNMGIQYRL